MKKPYLHHVHIVCKALQPMIDFWVQGLGATFVELRQFGGAEGAALECNSGTGLYIKVLPCESQSSPTRNAGVEHVGILVDDLDQTLAHIQTLPEGRVAKEPFVSGDLRCAFITGPEGILVEVMEQLP